MTNDAANAREDLAFLRNLVESDEPLRLRAFSEAYFASGLIYGGQMLLHAGQALGLMPGTPVAGLLIGLGPTALFIPVMIWIGIRNRNSVLRGATGQAVGRVFSAIGLANLALMVIIAWRAFVTHNLETWLIFPCAVFVLQGTAWFFAWMMRRRGWHGLVALGWFASAIAMALTIGQLHLFIIFAGLGLWLCMALPGYLLLHGRAA